MKMKQFLALSALGFCLALPAAQALEGGSIDSKIEELGKMTYLKVTDLRAARRDGLLRIQATVSNSANDKQQLYYRFRWIDADGFDAWEEGPWKPLLIHGLQKKVIQESAPTFKAKDFRLQLNSPDNASAAGNAGNSAQSGILNQ